MKGLYIHIPFCDHICTYCDFPKLFTKGQRHGEYLDALVKELELYREQTGFEQLETVYLGGGTPTALNLDQLGFLMDYLAAHIDLAGLKEFSVEANPENLTEEKIDFLLQRGVTRLSLGVQTFNGRLLETIGRKHRADDVFEAAARLRKRGFDNFNLDMIYAIPGQTMADLEADLELAVKLGPAHLSAYSLILEEHTPLYVAYMKDKAQVADQDLEADMYEAVMAFMARSGYRHYEISNYTKGAPSRHNLLYWRNEEYIGAGLGAHGYVAGTRYHNTKSINRYIQDLSQGRLPIAEAGTVDLKARVEEEFFLNLRLRQGLDLEAAEAKLGIKTADYYEKTLARFQEQGLLALEGSRLRLTREGLLLANEVFEAFLLNDD